MGSKEYLLGLLDNVDDEIARAYTYNRTYMPTANKKTADDIETLLDNVRQYIADKQAELSKPTICEQCKAEMLPPMSLDQNYQSETFTNLELLWTCPSCQGYSDGIKFLGDVELDFCSYDREGKKIEPPASIAQAD